MIPPNSISWLHLSDFHVGKDDYATRQMFRYILDHMQNRKHEGLIPDFIFVTGDLSNGGKQNEFDIFWEEFLLQLQELIGEDIEKRTFVVPGNHDVERSENAAFSRDEMSRTGSRHFDPTNEGFKLRSILLPRFKSYVSADCSSVDGGFNSPEGAFHKIIEIKSKKIGIVGINTAWLSKGEDIEKLTPGKALLEHALNRVSGVDITFVLGHHPLNWFLPHDQKAILRLLADHKAIYLYGHLHEAWADPIFGAGGMFLPIQSGAGFQAREGEPWKNGFLWGQIPSQGQAILLQPLTWSKNQQSYVLAHDEFSPQHRQHDWWSYPLPGSSAAIACCRPPATSSAPDGWNIVAAESLSKNEIELDHKNAINFFNGAVPGWQMAISSSVPRRKIVSAIIHHFKEADIQSRPIVTLVLGAGCEGKTTAILQSAYEIIKQKDNWRILRPLDGTASGKLEDILSLSADFKWLILLDEFDRGAEQLFSLLKRIPNELGGNFHFLIGCRDSDWRASRANEFDWDSVCTYSREIIAGLDLDEANAIVNAWSAYGDEGLGNLGRVEEAKRGITLKERADQESKSSHGAFFGALLEVRQGSDLQDHARKMLDKLSKRTIPGGSTLLDAIGFIAAMHSEGREFLSRPVLAHVLDCPPEKLQSEIIVPLGKEAAATTTTSFIYTRHRRVAEAIVSVLENEFSDNMADRFVQLASAALTAGKLNFIPEFQEWRYGLANYFFETDRQDLAINIARAVLQCEPQNCLTCIQVANLYRKAHDYEKASILFTQFEGRTNRGFYSGWSELEFDKKNLGNAAALGIYSLCDQSSDDPVTMDDSRFALVELCLIFTDLFFSFRKIELNEARSAIAYLGKNLITDFNFPIHEMRAQKDGAMTSSISMAIDQIETGLVVAKKYINSDLAGFSIPNDVSFEKLKDLFEALMLSNAN